MLKPKDPIYITIIGTPMSCWEPDVKLYQEVCLVKEPDNAFDTEAIMVKTTNGQHVGYVANSVKTVSRGTYSAGRLYDKLDECTKAVIKFITPEKLAIAEVKEC